MVHGEPRTWNITAPEGIEPHQLAMGALAFTGMAHALGWNFTETTPPVGTELTDDQLLATSHELFNDETYGQTALRMLSNIRYASTGVVFEENRKLRLHFNHSMYHFHYPTERQEVPGGYFDSDRMIADELRKTLGKVAVPFAYELRHRRDVVSPEYITYGYDRYLVRTHVVPAEATKEKLASYLQHTWQRYSNSASHDLHGHLGRAFDVLAVSSGAKEMADPAATAIEGETIDYREFYDFMGRELTPGLRKGLDDRIKNALRRQMCNGSTEPWGEVVVDGKTTLQASTGFPQFYFERLAASTLSNIIGSYVMPDPRMVDFLEAFQPEQSATTDLL